MPTANLAASVQRHACAPWCAPGCTTEVDGSVFHTGSRHTVAGVSVAPSRFDDREQTGRPTVYLDAGTDGTDLTSTDAREVASLLVRLADLIDRTSTHGTESKA